VQQILEHLLHTRIGSPRMSFKDVGGDSMTYVLASIELQRVIPNLPRDWPDRSIASLQAMADGSASTQRSRVFQAIDTSVLIRAVAPLQVVCFHFGPAWLAGGAALLLLVVGYNVARFMLDHIAHDRWGTVLRGLALRIFLPYWLVVGIYGVTHGGVSLPDVLLVGNFLGSHQTDLTGIETWFVQAIAQAVLVLFLLTRVPFVREGLRRRPFAAALGILALASAIRLLEPVVAPQLLAQNQGREFTWTFWLFALGLLIHAARTPRARIVASVALVGLALAFYPGDWGRTLTIAAGGLVLVWIDRVTVPRLAIPAIMVIGSASLFIYLLHLRAPGWQTPTTDWTVDLIRVAIGVGIGVVGWWLYERLGDVVQRVGAGLRRSAGGQQRVDL
jgi:hypothetical protein